jgi:two-component sensor histidine kinase
MLKRAALGESTNSIDTVRVRKDGSTVSVSVTMSPIRDDAGNRIVGASTIARDVTDRKLAEAALQESEARVRARTRALEGALKERETLLQEVHHRVKNNLQVISSLIHIQLRRVSDSHAREALEECKTRIQAIALIHEKLYQAKDYERIAFSDYARTLASSVFRAGRTSSADVTHEFLVDDVTLGVDRAIPCGLVLNELITNALKHAFKDHTHGIIQVELTMIDRSRLRLAVRDNGSGLPKGFDMQQTGSLGLQLVRALADQLGAELVVSAHHGTSFELTFSYE